MSFLQIKNEFQDPAEAANEVSFAPKPRYFMGRSDPHFPANQIEHQLSDSEDDEDYRPGGYHVVKVGDFLNNKRYQVLQKLGWGHFSTVWLCLDNVENRHCAVKIQKSDINYAEAARDEIRILNLINTQIYQDDRIPVVTLLNHFEEQGPNGLHVCLCFEVLGKSLLSLIKRYNYRGIPVALVKVIVRQVLEGLVYLHDECKIIHTDLKPENVLFAEYESEITAPKLLLSPRADRRLRLRPEEVTDQSTTRGDCVSSSGKVPVVDDSDTSTDGDCDTSISSGETYKFSRDQAFTYSRIKIVDFGNACWESRHFTEDIQTRQYRSPEVILGANYNQKADVWSLSCMVFELLTGDFLFDPQAGKDYDRDEDHLALMTELLGPLPSSFLCKGLHAGRYFAKNGELLRIKKFKFWNLKQVLLEKYRCPVDVAEELCSFLLPMLEYDPVDRVSARQALQHPFVNDKETVQLCCSQNILRNESSFADVSFAAQLEQTSLD